MKDIKIYHITHVDNLESIISDNCLLCESKCDNHKNIGYKHIKKRRRVREVDVSVGGVLADYVPFNFCSRSVMLYVVSQGHEDYSGGQRPIIHLVSSIDSIIKSKQPWAFTDRHAELGYSIQYDSLDDLDEIDWSVMEEKYWADTDVKEKRQAEFLVFENCHWTAIEKIIVLNDSIKQIVEEILEITDHKPDVITDQTCYY